MSLGFFIFYLFVYFNFNFYLINKTFSRGHLTRVKICLISCGCANTAPFNTLTDGYRTCKFIFYLELISVYFICSLVAQLGVKPLFIYFVS